MKLKLDITPDLAAMMAAEIKAGERAVTAATREAGTNLKTAWRGQITGAGLGQRLARTIRSEQYPKGRTSLSAAALVWSKAPVIIGAHDTGPLIRCARWAHHARRMGATVWAEAAVCLSADGAKPAGGRGAAEHEGSGGGVALEDWARQGHRADLPASAAGQAAEAAGPRAGCGASRGRCAGADRGELGGGAPSVTSADFSHRMCFKTVPELLRDVAPTSYAMLSHGVV